MKSKFISNIFTYNENSLLNNEVVRVVNYIILLLSIFMLHVFITNSSIGYKDISLNIIIGIISITIIIPTITNLKLNSVDFFEWDYTERKKRGRISNGLIVLSTIFSSTFVLSIILIVGDPLIFVYGKFNLFLTISHLIIPFSMLVNLIKSYELHHFIFEDDLKQAYKIQRKPEWWIEEGKEINPDDEIKEIMQRDFGV